MKNWLPILASLAVLITSAQAGERTVVQCDGDEEDCKTYSTLQLEGDGVQVLYLGDEDQEPRFLPLSRVLTQRGYLGVSLTELSPELREHFRVASDHGVLVSRVEEDSPAEMAGVEVGDVVTLIDGEEVHSSRDLSRVVREKEEGDLIDIEIWRDGHPQTLSATAAERQKTQIDLSGLTIALEGFEDLGEMEGLQHLRQMDWQSSIDVDSINKIVLESMESLKGLEGANGRYVFNLDPETVEEFRKSWEENFLDEDGNVIMLESLEGMGEKIADRMHVLEERLRELEAQVADED
jgi:hypothetical protein